MDEKEKKEFASTKTIAMIAFGISLFCAVVLITHVIHDALAFSEIRGQIKHDAR